MIKIFGRGRERLALDLSTIRGVIEGPRMTRIYLQGETEPFAVEEDFDYVLKAWEAQSNCVCGE
jgi:hypothetical protein